MHAFRKYILAYSNISKEDWALIEANLQKRIYEPGELILEEGQICRKLYFLEAGFLRFFVDREGETVTKFFTKAPYCFTAQKSLTQEIPTKDNIEVLQQALIWEMSKTDAFELFKLPKWSEFVRKLIQEVQFNTEEILESLQNDTAEERYIRMIEENDTILQKAPLKHIASYLGIAPQSLSRIRKKYANAKRKLT